MAASVCLDRAQRSMKMAKASGSLSDTHLLDLDLRCKDVRSQLLRAMLLKETVASEWGCKLAQSQDEMITF